MRRYILVNLLALFVLFNAFVLIASVTEAKVNGHRRLMSIPGSSDDLTIKVGFPPFVNLPPYVRPGASGRREYCNIMSQHNLSLMYKGFLSFAQDNNQRFPWQLTTRGVRQHIDARATVQGGFGQQVNGNVNLVKMHPRVAAVGGSVGILAVKNEIRMAKVLLSPCDVSRKRNNDLIDKFWNIYDTKAVRPVPHSGMSYGICFGADTQRPSTVFAASRNLTTKDLSTAKWAGAENAALGIPELKAGQGYLAWMDGSTSLSTDADLGLSGKVTRNHFRARGGVAKGRSSTLMALPY